MTSEGLRGNSEATGTAELDAASPAGALLVAESLVAGYGKREILHGISLSLSKGEIVALIGPNGAGKSTILRVLAGLVRPTSGRLFYCGNEITHLPAHRRTRAGIATVLQGGPIFPTLTLEEHVGLAHRARRLGRRLPEAGRGGDELLLPHLSERRGHLAGFLSGGERQALAVATALASRPRVLLCDEASAGLAPGAAEELLRLVADASRRMGVPILWVEQRVGSILTLASRAVLLRGGRIVAETRSPRSWLDGDALGEATFGLGL